MHHISVVNNQQERSVCFSELSGCLGVDVELFVIYTGDSGERFHSP